jgi:hypothetical protein
VGLLDALLGRTKPVRANLDALFALPSAAITLQSTGGLVLSGSAGVCWKPPAGQSAQDVQREIGELLEIPDDDDRPGATSGDQGDGAPGGVPSGAGGHGALTQAEDAYGFRWLLLQDPSADDLVARVHLVNSTLTDNGWGPQLLCSVFGLVPGPDAGTDVRPMYLVYLYKRGTFYPFAPDGKEHRDNELELRVRAMVGSDLPVESDLSRWFPLWDLPVR